MVFPLLICHNCHSDSVFLLVVFIIGCFQVYKYLTNDLFSFSSCKLNSHEYVDGKCWFLCNVNISRQLYGVEDRECKQLSTLALSSRGRNSITKLHCLLEGILNDHVFQFYVLFSSSIGCTKSC